MGGQGSGAKPRNYPTEVIEQIRRLYCDEGLSIAEVQSRVTGVKVQNVMGRYGIPRRRAIKRNQAGEANSSWKGDNASYQALHLRVATARGTPNVCEKCGSDDRRCEWANLTGNYYDVWDYARMCLSCHRRYDADRRRATGERTVPPALQKGGGANV